MYAPLLLTRWYSRGVRPKRQSRARKDGEANIHFVAISMSSVPSLSTQAQTETTLSARQMMAPSNYGTWIGLITRQGHFFSFLLAKRSAEAAWHRLTDVDPLITHRGHHGAVTCLATAQLPSMVSLPALPDEESEPDALFLSGGIDATVRLWRFASTKRAAYPPYGNLFHYFLIAEQDGLLELTDHDHYSLVTLIGHTDAVWSLTSLPHPVNPLVASSSADGTVRLWSLAAALQGTDASALECVLQIKKLCNATPTSVRAGHSQQQIAIGRSDGKVSIFDLANGGSKEACVLSGSGSIGKVFSQQMYSFMGCNTEDIEKRDAGNHPTPEQCNALAVHPTEPLIVTAHEDKSVRLYDTRTGQCEYSMVAHLDSVGSIDYSADGKTVITGGIFWLFGKRSGSDVRVFVGHDSSVRFWNFAAEASSKNLRSCIQEFTAHRQKNEEGVCSVAMRKVASRDGCTWAASGGGDSMVKIMSSI